MRKIIILTTILILTIAVFKSGIQAQMEQPKFTVGGFMSINCIALDFNEEHSLLSLKGFHSMEPAFSQSDLNLYFIYNSQKNWLAMSEIKFTYLLGNFNQKKDESMPNVIYNESVSFTYTDEMLRTYDLGGIFIERAFIEYNQFQFAKIRFGRFFTPFGIFSQDHGAPAVTSVRAPNLVIAPTPGANPSFGMPLHQTGGELLGSVYLGDFGFEYAVYMSNGPSEDPNSNGDNTMCRGGFLNLILPSFFDMINIELGGSVYQGKRTYTDSNYIDLNSFTADESQDIYDLKQKDFISSGHLKISILGLPFDGILLMQTEYLNHKITDKTENSPIGYGVAPVEDTDYNIMYAQIEYQMFGMLTPYFRYENESVNNEKSPFYLMLLERDQYVCGLNIKPIPTVSLKFEYMQVTVKQIDLAENFGIENDYKWYAFQIAMAFL